MRRAKVSPGIESLERRIALAGVGGTSIASADVNGDGYSDVVMGSSRGGQPKVQVLSGFDGSELRNFLAYQAGFKGGVQVAATDVNGDGAADIITGAGGKGDPHVKVFSGATGAEIRSFFAFEPTTKGGGVFVAAGDINSDGSPEILVGRGAGSKPTVRAFSSDASQIVREIQPYDSGFRGGVRVATGDVDGDRVMDIITGAGPGGGPHVKAYSGSSGAEIRSFFAYDDNFKGGVFVAGGGTTGLGVANIVTGAGSGVPRVKVLHGDTLEVLEDYLAFPADYRGGVQVASPEIFVPDANLNGSNLADILVGANTLSFGRKANEVALGSGFAINQSSIGLGLNQRLSPQIILSEAEDSDRDGLSNRAESNLFGTDPLSFDTDGDLLSDAFESRARNLSPLRPDDIEADPDGDQFSTFDEAIHSTRPDVADSDADGVSDRDEVFQGSDPNDPKSKEPIPDGEKVFVNLTVGDHSGSHSERYNLVVGDVIHQAPEFGVVRSADYLLQKRKAYDVQVLHTGSNLSSPDYDYTALIQPVSGQSEDLIVLDPSGILGVHDESNPFFAAGKKAYIYIGEMTDPATLNALAQSILKTARQLLADDPSEYKYGGIPLFAFKCNQFVYDVLTAAGYPAKDLQFEFTNRFGFESMRPILAGNYADPDFKIPGLPVVTGPAQPGDIVAIATENGVASGHVAIVSGPGTTISAAAFGFGNGVTESDWGFRENQKPTIRRPEVLTK